MSAELLALDLRDFLLDLFFFLAPLVVWGSEARGWRLGGVFRGWESFSESASEGEEEEEEKEGCKTGFSGSVAAMASEDGRMEQLGVGIGWGKDVDYVLLYKMGEGIINK